MSAGEIVLILFVYLLFFGAKGIPSLAQTLGKAVYQFRNAAKDVQDEIMSSANEIKKEVQNNVRLDQMDMEDEHPTNERARPIPQRKDPEVKEEKPVESKTTDSTSTPEA
ncbi:MAG: twin-arginine translocase TatA/TatE family subunit [Flavobacteriales bacterium]